MGEPGPRRPMVIPTLWLQVAILTFIFGFAVLALLARLIAVEHPPIPARVVDEHGALLFSGDDVMAGQQLFQRYGLMEFGSIFGHGAYLGPDFTAEYLHEAAGAASEYYQEQGVSADEARARV
jgi:nitric oxide reductase subunit B